MSFGSPSVPRGFWSVTTATSPLISNRRQQAPGPTEQRSEHLRRLHGGADALVNKLTSVRLGGISGGSRDTHRQIHGVTR